MTAVAVHLSGYFCATLYLLRVRFYAFSAEKGAVKGDLQAFYLTFSTVEDKATVVSYLH